MKKVLLIILGLVVAFVAIVLIIASTKPNSFQVKRTVSIQAKPEMIYPFIVDFHKWNAWSPFDKLDPDMKRIFSGPESGEGSMYSWNGNKKAGAGAMEIEKADVPSKVTIKLDFLKPFKSQNMIEFSLVPNGELTDVTWAMYGPSPFMSKVMQVFISMDKMVGKDFETGLHNIKVVAEKSNTNSSALNN
jgi:hypothetical protein